MHVFGFGNRIVVMGAIVLGLAVPALPQAAKPPAGATPAATASGNPADAGPAANPKVTTLLDYLEKDAYGKKLAAPFWVTRAMGVISLSRLPRASTTAKLLEVLEKDKHDVVRLLAWQGVLARASELDAKTHQRWMTATLALGEKGAFQGSLRVALLDALATAPPNARAKRIWQQIFTDTNAWEPQDIPALYALGRTLAAWKSPTLLDALIKGLVDQNAGVRAEVVLHAAGCDTKTARENLKPEVFDPLATAREHPASSDLFKRVQTDAAAWFTKNRAEWKEVTKVDGEPWKQLSPLYIPAPVPLDQVDPDDKLWTADLEIGRADIDQMEAVFVVDATGSMGDVLAWLRRDVARVMSAFGLLCKEPPSLGVVFYRDKGLTEPWVTKVLPMTFKPQDLAPGLTQMTADGGGDIPEAVLEGLTAGIDGMKWRSKNKKTGKIVVLMGDAPPKPGTEPQCEAIAKKGLEQGIKTYAVKLTTADGRNDLASFDGIATAGGGSTVEATFGRLTNFRIIGPDGKEKPLITIDRPEAQLVVAPTSADQAPGERVLVHILTDLINPQYKDRVEPLAQTLLAHVAPKSEPEKRLAFMANTPPLNRTTFNSQKK